MAGGSPLDRLAAQGLTLRPGPASVGLYAPTHRTGRLLWVAGHTARNADAPARSGVVGADLSVAEAAEQAALAALNMLGTVHDSVGLDRVDGVAQLRGYVRGGADFTEQSAVINGASALLASVFPDAAPHARAAVGVISLPGGACVELEAVFVLLD